MKGKIIFLLGLLAAGVLFFKIKSPALTVTGIIDGDTIKLSDGRTVRYIGVDTPELTNNECFSQEAKQINQNLILNKKVRIETDKNEIDQYGRTLAYVFSGNLFVNEYLLSLGAGKFFMDYINTRYSSVLVKAGSDGHNLKRGLWTGCSPGLSGCLIKGNLDKLDKRFYHLPTFRYYSATSVNLLKGDQWFCTEAEAEKAGFQRARE